MKGREELCKDLEELRELISTYKVLKIEQFYKAIKNKEHNVKKEIIAHMKNSDKLFLFKDLCSASDNWINDYDKSLIKAFWILLDFWNEVEYNTKDTFPAKIFFITKDDSFDIIVAEKGQEKMLNVFYNRFHDKTTKHLVAVEDEEQMIKLSFDGIAAFCIVNEKGTVSYYRNEG